MQIAKFHVHLHLLTLSYDIDNFRITPALHSFFP